MTDKPRSLQLFCVPHAGGRADAFRGWQSSFPSHIDVIPLELAGRGRRFRDPFATSLHEAADDLLVQLRERLSAADFVVLGHCMGSVVAYEMVRRLEAAGPRTPRLLVVSGRNAPHVPNRWALRLAPLGDEEVLAELTKIGGVPRGLSIAMATSFLTALRADQRMSAGYSIAGPSDRLRAGILALASRDDELTNGEGLARWADYTAAEYRSEIFTGNHYFLYPNGDRVAQLVEELS